MRQLKPDASEIKQFLDTLAEQDWVKRTERRWWPMFVFHYTDIHNAISILQEGYLYSRKYAEENEILGVSSGSSSVLAGTSASIKDKVRLYFRPKTPTQYYAEGILSEKNLLTRPAYKDVHCPTPVFFLFDASEILALVDCEFSDGNLASSRAQTFSTAEDLKHLPWNEIYHTGHINKHQRDSIVFHRNAEVVFPEKLNLNNLQYIYCRSGAERETLFHLLSPELINQYYNKIVSTTKNTLFFREHTFIETARLDFGKVILSFSPDTESPGPFSLKVEYIFGGKQKVIEKENFRIESPYNFSIPAPTSNYAIQVFLDEHLVYANEYQSSKVPF